MYSVLLLRAKSALSYLYEHTTVTNHLVAHLGVTEMFINAGLAPQGAKEGDFYPHAQASRVM